MKIGHSANLVAGCVLATALVGCSTPEEKAAYATRDAARADLKIKEERLKMIDQYKACVKDAGGYAQNTEACDGILKAIEALK